MILWFKFFLDTQTVRHWRHSLSYVVWNLCSFKLVNISRSYRRKQRWCFFVNAVCYCWHTISDEYIGFHCNCCEPLKEWLHGRLYCIARGTREGYAYCRPLTGSPVGACVVDGSKWSSACVCLMGVAYFSIHHQLTEACVGHIARLLELDVIWANHTDLNIHWKHTLTTAYCNCCNWQPSKYT